MLCKIHFMKNNESCFTNAQQHTITRKRNIEEKNIYYLIKRINLN